MKNGRKNKNNNPSFLFLMRLKLKRVNRIMKISVKGKIVTIECQDEDEATGLAWGIGKARGLIEEGKQYIKQKEKDSS